MRVAARLVVLVWRAVLGLDVVVLDDLLDLSSGVLEISLGAQTLGDDCDMVVVPSRIKFILYSTNIDFFLIDHNHHLPLVLILGHTSVSWASEQISSHVVMGSLRLGVDDCLRHLFFWSEGFHELKFDLSKLVFALTISYLVSQSDLHWSVIIVAVIINVLFSHRLHLAFSITTLAHSFIILHLLWV